MKNLLSKVMLMAILAAMASFAAATPALAEEQQFSPSDIFEDPQNAPSSPNGPFGSQTICDRFPDICGGPKDPVLDPGPVVDPAPPDKGPKICKVFPELCGGPKDPVLDPTPPDPTEPPDPPKPEKCKDGQVKDKDGKCIDNGKDTGDNDNTDNNGGGSGNGSGTGSDYGSGAGPASGALDRGGVFMSNLLPNAFTSTLENAGNSVKKSFPAPVAKSLPNTGGGWSFLLLAGAALIAGGFVLRSLVKRITGTARTA